MDNDELIKKEEINEDESQAVQKSELLPIYENMGFAGDIQPLEDVEIPDEVKLSILGKKTENRIEKKKHKQKKFSGFRMPKITSVPKIIIVAILVLAVIGGGFAVANVASQKADANKAGVVDVYTTPTNSAVMVFSDGTTKEVPSAQKAMVSDDGRYLYYTRSTASKTGKYDLYLLDSWSRKSVKKGGQIIEIGVDDDWQINSDGSVALYGVTQNSEKSYYIFDAERKDSELISDSVKQAYLPYSGDVVYFTHGDANNSLQRKRLGEKAELVANNVSFVRMAKGDDGFEVIYTIPSGTSLNVDVYMTDGVSEPKLVSKNVSEVYLDNYVYGGNLYYFIKDNANVNWQDFIDDSLYDTDATLEKPVEGDYMIEKGFIFKRYVLDSDAYNKAVSAYNEKMIRDTVRAALSDLDLGLAVKDEYTCYAYSDSKSTKLVNGVTLDNIIEFTSTGEPRIIYRKSTIGVDNKISMDKLVSITKSDGVDSAMNYVNDIVYDSYELSNNCNYAWFDSNKVLSYEIKDYSLNKTTFLFGSRDMMYAVCDGDLYCNEISSLELSKKVLVDTDVDEYSVEENFIYYLKKESDSSNSLYRYSKDAGKEKIADNVYSYFVSGENVIVMSRNTERDTIDVGAFDSTSFKAIDTEISLDKFMYTEESFSYMKNYTAKFGGDMYNCVFGGETKKIASNAVNILYAE